MEKDKIIKLEQLFMTLSSKYNFETKDHNEVYNKITELLDDLDLDNLHKLGTMRKVKNDMY
jgi:hypothetical protein